MLTTDKRRLIDAVMTGVLRIFVWTSDREAWGTQEYWASLGDCAKSIGADGKLEGDCDDFVVLVRGKLASVGIDSHAVFCTLPWLPAGDDGHLVVEVEGLIMDCCQRIVVPRDDLNYVWVSRSGILPGQPWHKIT